MKCIILAGGRGERLWPLSRKNYPKQFIEIQKNHSVFQETVARNVPFCDEFIIVTSLEYRFIVENQMKAFQGISYRCIFEEIPRKTTASILLTCLGFQPSDLVFVVAADHIIDSQMSSIDSCLGYKDAIIQAKEYAKQGNIVLFGKETTEISSRYGYITNLGNDGIFDCFVEKPKNLLADLICDKIHRNLGLLLFENGVFQNELRKLNSSLYGECKKAYKKQIVDRNSITYSKAVLETITPVSIERSLVQETSMCKAIDCCFGWNDVSCLEDIADTDFKNTGVSVANSCTNTLVLNNVVHQAVVVNELEDVIVVNTKDSVYVSKYGSSEKMKEILKANDELKKFSDKGTVSYREWGYFEDLIEQKDYRVRQVNLFPGYAIHSDKHSTRSENWTIVKGTALVTINGESYTCGTRDNIDIPVGVEHQIANIGKDTVVFVETAVGEILQEDETDIKNATKITESDLGYTIEPLIKLIPAYKDYLWGGTKLRDIYGKKCDYDKIAESWELSTHPDGPSIIANGKHKGQSFSDYLANVGKEVLGWKCNPLQSFPLLIKFIDAKGNLSVQVHPDDDYALENENQYGKNEMWYVVDAEPGAGLYVGFNKDITRKEVAERVANNTIMEVLNFFPTHPGDVFFIPAGTVHAIGEGNLICEIQQSSNCTYRLYDYDRRDKYGNPRELHLEKALDVLNYKKYEQVEFESEEDADGTMLSRCKYFEAKVFEVDGVIEIPVDDTKFQAIVCINGSGEVSFKDSKMTIKAGESMFIPAINGNLEVKGNLSIVLSHV